MSNSKQTGNADLLARIAEAGANLARLDESVLRPWRAVESPENEYTEPGEWYVITGPGTWQENGDSGVLDKSRADFIAECRNALPGLAALLAEAGKEIAACRELLAQIADAPLKLEIRDQQLTAALRERDELAAVSQLLDEIDCCHGYTIGHKDMPKFWEAQEKARAILAKHAGQAATAGELCDHCKRPLEGDTRHLVANGETWCGGCLSACWH